MTMKKPLIPIDTEKKKFDQYDFRVTMKFPFRPGGPVRLRPGEKLVTITTTKAKVT